MQLSNTSLAMIIRQFLFLEKDHSQGRKPDADWMDWEKLSHVYVRSAYHRNANDSL